PLISPSTLFPYTTLFRSIRIEDVPAIWERIEGSGLTTQEACGDTPRVILGCPLAGVDAGEIVDGTPQIRAIADRYLGDPANLRRDRKSTRLNSSHVAISY